LVGGALWGVPGMFLSIPITAIAKVIMDRTESTKAWGFLLGDAMTPTERANSQFPDPAREVTTKTS
jgi:predicted PurR-regulated permease PerM